MDTTATSPPDAFERAADTDTPDEGQVTDELLAELKAETEALDVGDAPRSDDERHLYRYLRRRQQLAAEAERVKANTERLLKQIESRVRGLDVVYGTLAESVVRGLLAGEKRKKSITTPFGTAGFRSVPVGLEVVNEDLVPAEFKPAVPRLDKAALARAFKDTGEIPPGCETKGGGEKFYVK